MTPIEFLYAKHIDIIEALKSGNFSGKKVIYVNPVNYLYLRKRPDMFDELYYVVDGFYFRFLLKVFLGARGDIPLQAFDFSGIARPFLEICQKTGVRVFVAGGSGNDIELFKNKISEIYPTLSICGVENGYVSDDALLGSIRAATPEVVLLGLGSPRQEALAFKAESEEGCSFVTCGAFISQTAVNETGKYYPDFIVRWNIRWLYRILREPHVIRRIFLFYPRVVWFLFIDVLRFKYWKRI